LWRRASLVTDWLAALSPLATLGRGYAVVRQAGSGQIVSDPGQLADDAELRVTVRGGEFTAVARTET
ncbi:MAG TPA: hypothetical protein PLO33_11840, partial [Kouleothrix sp.]|nr:hypothetical protein [Kouleothrix sp.]